MALLAGLSLFLANAVWAVGLEPETWSPPAEAALQLGIYFLGMPLSIAIGTSFLFRSFYRSDDRQLIQIEQSNQEAMK